MTATTTPDPSPAHVWPHTDAADPRPGLRWTISDAVVLIGRSLRHTVRNVDGLVMSAILPVVMLLLFVYVFGGAIEVGTDYINYVVPGIILLTASFGSAITATTVTADMTEGIIDRFRSMPIYSSVAVLGHVVASMVRNLFVTALVFGVALALGFRPSAGVVQWLGVVGILSLFVLAVTWVAVVIGLLARSVDAASGFTFSVIFLPYVSSAFVPTETMPSVLHGFAEHQPVTPIIETARGLLLGTPIGNRAWIGIAWCVGILLVAVPVSAALFRRRTRV